MIEKLDTEFMFPVDNRQIFFVLKGLTCNVDHEETTFKSNFD